MPKQTSRSRVLLEGSSERTLDLRVGVVNPRKLLGDAPVPGLKYYISAGVRTRKLLKEVIQLSRVDFHLVFLLYSSLTVLYLI